MERLRQRADFLAAAQLHIPIEGEPLALLRRAKIAQHQNLELWIIERHGTRGFYASYDGPPATVRVGDRVYLA